MDKLILAILAGAVVLHLAGAFETNGSDSGDGDNPPMADAPLSSDNAAEEAQGKGTDGKPRATVIVYGRDASRPTERMLAKLEAAEVEHRYKSIEDQKAMLEVGMRLKKKGYEKDSYQLPVVGIDEHTLVQPRPARVIARVKPDAE